MERLITDHLYLVKYIVSRHYGWHPERDDLEAVGNLAIVKAAQQYKTEMDFSFKTYAYNVIRRDVYSYIQYLNRPTRKPNGGLFSLDQPVKEETETELYELVGTDPDGVISEVEKNLETELIQEALNHLDDEKQEIIELSFGLSGQLETTQREIAKRLGRSTSYISRHYKKGLRQLEEILGKETPAYQ